MPPCSASAGPSDIDAILGRQIGIGVSRALVKTQNDSAHYLFKVDRRLGDALSDFKLIITLSEQSDATGRRLTDFQNSQHSVSGVASPLFSYEFVHADFHRPRLSLVIDPHDISI